MVDSSTFEKQEKQTYSRMLAPAAYSETAIPSLRLARSSRLARSIGKWIFISLLLTVVIVAMAPWQQSVKGTGNVIAYAPNERQQTIESPIKGRIARLGDSIVENAFVKKGELIVEIEDIDPEYLTRLEGQQTATQQQVNAARNILDATQKNLTAANTIIISLKGQQVAYQNVKIQVEASADAAIESAKNKVDAEKQQLLEHEAALGQIQADYDRQKILYEEKIVSQLKYQEIERKLKEVKAKVAKSKAYIDSAKNDLIGKQRDRSAKEQKAQVDIDYATAALQKAMADIAKAESEVAKSQSDLSKSQKELLEMETKLARQQSQTLVAPFDGFVTSITPNQGSQILKEGDPICVIVPDSADRSVQIWLNGNDAPLVEPGRHVRIQFEGWPAVQFAGWPSVAVGTFGGEIVSVDPIDNGKGKFRALVLPDSESEWPNERYLRQGVRVNSWVLLDKVPLWYEIWRNMNGFPPVVSDNEPKDKTKVPKLPKS